MADRRCSVDGCARLHYGKGFCRLHYDRVRARGTTDLVTTRRPRPDMAGANNRGWRGDAVSTDGAHRRVRKARGPASDYPCVECGGPAKEWAYDHLDPDERHHPHGPFSLKIEHYQPMCVRCHRHFDGSVDALRNRRR